MFDITNAKSFDNAREWKQELDSKVELPNGEQIPCILLGNKVLVHVIMQSIFASLL